MREMTPVANPILVLFRNAHAPAEWASKQARRIYEAAIEQEAAGTWTDHAVTGSIKLDVQPTEPFVSPYGTDEAVAANTVRRYIASERHRIDRLEQDLALFGGQHFLARREQVRGPKHPFDAEQFLTNLISRPGLRAIWVHGVKFVRDTSRSFVRAQD